MYKEIADISGSTRSNLLVSLKISSDLEVNGNSKFSILESSKIILRSFSRFLIGADEFSYLFLQNMGHFFRPFCYIRKLVFSTLRADFTSIPDSSASNSASIAATVFTDVNN